MTPGTNKLRIATDGDGLNLALLALFFLILNLFTWLSQTGLIPGIDEACYVQWAVTGKALDPKIGFLALKLIPVSLIRQLVGALGYGIGAFYTMKAIFALFTLGFLAAVYAWRRAEGCAPNESLLATLLVAVLPVVMNASGRLLSEMPALAFLAAGIALATHFEKRQQGKQSGFESVLALVLPLGCFWLAYLSRTTVFTTIYAWAAWRVLDRAFAHPAPKNPVVRAVLQDPAVWIAVLFTMLLVAWHWRFALPAFPLSYVGVNLSDFQRPFDANMAAFVLALGCHAPLLVIAYSWFAPPGAGRRAIIALLFLIMTAGPFLYIMIKGGEILPRHLADLAIPMSVLLAIPLGAASAKRRMKSHLIAAVVILIFLGYWVHLLRTTDGWVKKFTHHVLYMNEPPEWLVFVALATAAWYVMRRYINSQAGRAYLLAGCFVILFGHVWLAFPAIRTDGCMISPVQMRTMLQYAGVGPDETVAFPAPDYEGAVAKYCLPEWRIEALNFKTLEPFEGKPAETYDYLFVADHIMVDRPDLLEVLAPEATPVTKRGQVTLYRINAAASGGTLN